MLLTVNISNSNILMGVFHGQELAAKVSFHTDRQYTADEYALKFISLLQLKGIHTKDIDGVITACVVPGVQSVIKDALASVFSCKIYTVGPGLKTGVKIHTEIPSQVGAGLICQSAAILAEFKPPCILISMGTALSIFAIDAGGCFVGGAILPGIKMGAKALSMFTAQLPDVDISTGIKNVIGANTVQNIQSGLVIGTACAIDGMIERFKQQLGPNTVCVGTGGMLPRVIDHCRSRIIYRENLVLDGLRLIYEKNAK